VSLQTWQETLINSQVDGSALASSTTATSLLPPAARYTLPANYLQIGRMFRIKFAGRLSNIVTTPGTITFDVRMGPTSNIVVFNGGAMQMSTTAHTNVPIVGEVTLTCRAIGNSTNANFMGQGWALSQALSLTAVADSTTTPAHLLMPNTAPAVGTGFDSTVAMVVDLYGTFSINNAGNSVTIHQYSLEALN
jgi:hypothetical protein